jgi:hypothetical protein
LTHVGAEKYGFRMHFPGWPKGFHLLLGVTLVTAMTVGATAANAKDDDRTVAESTLREVEASPRGKELAKEPTARAREALERAQRLRDVRDEARARLCDGLARTWAETARDVVRAAELEGRSEAARASATDAGAQLERERALLEEGLGQQGRLRAQLEALEHEAKRGPDRTSAVAKEDPKKTAIPGDVPEGPAPKKGPPATKPAPSAKPIAPIAPKKGAAK